MLYAIIGVLVIIADQWVKFWVQGNISMESVGEPFLPGILSLVNLHNDGAAFSFLSGSGARIPFIVLTGVFVLAVIIALATNFISGRVARWSIVLVAAGGLSNCIDRVIYGYVQDMFKTEFISFPVFNLADVFITVFCLIFVLAILFERERDDDDDYDDLYEEEEEDLPRRSSAAAEKRAARAADLAFDRIINAVPLLLAQDERDGLRLFCEFCHCAIIPPTEGAPNDGPNQTPQRLTFHDTTVAATIYLRFGLTHRLRPM